MYVHVSDITTCTSSRYGHERHTDHSGKDIEFKKFKNIIIPSGGTHAQGTGGFMRTSRYSALFDVADHSRCRTMFAVQFLERLPGSRWSEEEEEDVEVTRKKRAVAETLTKNLIVRTHEVSLDERWFQRLALLTLCARRGLEQEW
jgi:hypothetical protein